MINKKENYQHVIPNLIQKEGSFWKDGEYMLVLQREKNFVCFVLWGSVGHQRVQSMLAFRHQTWMNAKVSLQKKQEIGNELKGKLRWYQRVFTKPKPKILCSSKS